MLWKLNFDNGRVILLKKLYTKLKFIYLSFKMWSEMKNVLVFKKRVNLYVCYYVIFLVIQNWEWVMVINTKIDQVYTLGKFNCYDILSIFLSNKKNHKTNN